MKWKATALLCMYTIPKERKHNNLFKKRTCMNKNKNTNNEIELLAHLQHLPLFETNIHSLDSL